MRLFRLPYRLRADLAKRLLHGAQIAPRSRAMARHDSDRGKAPSQRQLRVGELIRRTLSDILMRGEIHDPDLNRMSITVTEVRTSPDLRIATVFVLPLGGNDPEGALAALRRNRHEIRRAVNKGMTLKFSAELKFIIDESFDRMDETRRLLNQEAVRRDVEKPDAPEDS